MKRFFLTLISIFCVTSALFAQMDSAILLQGIDIIEGRNSQTILSTTPVQTIDNKQIKGLPAIQVSDVIKLFSGVIIKDYGGVGGMKTVSVRGFGAQHTSVAYDGIAVTNCQTGQIDLSRFSLQNVEKITLNNGFEDDIFIPARLFAAAALINIASSAPQFADKKPVNIDLRVTGGSFGYINPMLLLENRIASKKKNKKVDIFSSLNVNYLNCKGNYPFTIFYGGINDSTSRERRNNSDVQNFTAEENLYFHFSTHSKLNFKFYYHQSECGLPGAVIFYNSAAKQRLKSQDAFGQAHFEKRFNAKFAYQANLKFNYAYQQYLDPEYLNSAGFLDNKYYQREVYLSNTFLYIPHKIISLSLSNDLIYNNLNTNTGNFATPERYSSLTLLSCFLDTRVVDIRAGLLHTFVANKVKVGAAAANTNRLSPAAGISIKPLLNADFVIRMFYKNIFRLPTFNDLYYRDVGNVTLNPENTHQLNFGLAYEQSFLKKSISLSVSADGYYNIVKDKIIAIPNKNLFVWTMLNLGKVSISGIELRAAFKYNIRNNISLHLSGNYDFQRAIDITDVGSKTYKHQIPYTPLHAGSISLAFNCKYMDIMYTILFCGQRYALQQNTDANLLAPYSDHSITIAKDFQMRHILLGAKIELLNLADKHYEIVKNYPMQGRSIRMGIHFKW